jgi:resuscitation-promoting factor RpfB
MKRFALGILTIPLLALGCTSTKTSAPQPPKNQASSQVNKSAAECDPNYSGCVPIASDVDCAGGGGNGPAYVKGPVTVIGEDIYGLDRDGDGVGCE